MDLPFTRDQFFDVLAAYNTALWPLVLALWIVTVVLTVRLFRAPRTGGRLIVALLATQWAFASLGYHAAFFTSINPAAWMFAALFLVESVLLAWYGLVRNRLRWSAIRSRWQVVGWMLAVYAILYPLIARAEGHAYPRLPTFGVPCPTTILTIGLLIAADPPLPRALAIVPIAWASLGGQAAFLLGVRTDLMLLASGIIMLVYILTSFSRTTNEVTTHAAHRDAA